MANYLFIESRDPFESRDTSFIEEIAPALKERGNEVTVFLVQNAALAARKDARVSFVKALSAAGVGLMVDDFSLSERGIQLSEIPESIRCSNIDSLVDFLIREGTKVIWH